MSLTLYGVSAELVAAIDGLRECPGIHGNKYHRKDIDALAQMILCRNYGKATLELSYLLFGVLQRESDKLQGKPGATQQAWLHFFWLDEAISPSRFRAAFDRTVSPHPDSKSQLKYALGDAGLVLTFTDHSFTLSPTRIAVLASLLEFLVYIDPGILQQDTLFDAAALNNGSAAAIKSLASQLQALLYGFLNEHMQPAQQQRRFRHLWAWLRNNASTKESVSYQQVTDAAILAFWQQAVPKQTAPKQATANQATSNLVSSDMITSENSDEPLGFRRYRTVAENFFDLRQALECVSTQQKMAGAIGIGEETESGEISANLLQQTLETIEIPTLDVSILAKNPKFITKQQAEVCSQVVEVATITNALPLTIMRMHCFGEWQASLVQALRNKKQTYIEELLGLTPTSYQQFFDVIRAQKHILQDARDCGVHVLLNCQAPEIIGILLHDLPEPLISIMHAYVKELLPSTLGNSESDESYAIIDNDIARHTINELDAARRIESSLHHQFFQQWPRLLLQNPVLNEFVQRLQQTFKANNRQGFKKLPDRGDCLPYVEGVQMLEVVQMRCNQYLEALKADMGKDIGFVNESENAANGIGNVKFCSDLAIFREGFISLYRGRL